MVRSLRLPLLLCLAVLGLTLVGAAPALAAPKSLQGSAYGLMKGFMTTWDKDGFASVSDLGATKRYQRRLAECTIKVDPTLRDSNGNTPNAVYGPEPDVITFSRDPRTLPAGDREAFGETVWHEVTHALEDTNGDDQTSADKLFNERNTEYMTCVAKEALPWLDQLEKKAKAGASAAELTTIWKKYLDKMDYAAKKLDETKKYPPDFALMKGWFGFYVNADTVKKMYLTSKAYSGDKWRSLRAALADQVSDWSGTWEGNFSGTLVLEQEGDAVTGTNTSWPAGDYAMTGTASENVLKGQIRMTGFANGATFHCVHDFELTMSADGLTFRGWDEEVGSGPHNWGRTQWTGWRPGGTPFYP